MCGGSHFITLANANSFGHHFKSGELNSRSIFRGERGGKGKSLSDRSCGGGEHSEAKDRLFPLGSNPAALSQTDIFYRLSSKIHGNCSGNCKSPSLSMPRPLARWVAAYA